jgi:hypothetical protein
MERILFHLSPGISTSTGSIRYKRFLGGSPKRSNKTSDGVNFQLLGWPKISSTFKLTL